MKEIAAQKQCLLAEAGSLITAELERRHREGRPYGKQLTSDGVHMNPLGDAIMAEAILRTLGADDEAMRAIRETWRQIPNPIQAQTLITLREYEALDQAAKRQGTSVPALSTKLLKESLQREINAESATGTN